LRYNFNILKRFSASMSARLGNTCGDSSIPTYINMRCTPGSRCILWRRGSHEKFFTTSWDKIIRIKPLHGSVGKLWIVTIYFSHLRSPLTVAASSWGRSNLSFTTYVLSSIAHSQDDLFRSWSLTTHSPERATYIFILYMTYRSFVGYDSFPHTRYVKHQIERG
jgi:hypothetical protein